MTPGFHLDGEQLELWSVPWLGVPPRELTKSYLRFGHLKRTFVKPARGDEIFTDPAQLTLRLEGGPFGS